jgi:hypothetical protein
MFLAKRRFHHHIITLYTTQANRQHALEITGLEITKGTGSNSVGFQPIEQHDDGDMEMVSCWPSVWFRNKNRYPLNLVL